MHCQLALCETCECCGESPNRNSLASVCILGTLGNGAGATATQTPAPGRSGGSIILNSGVHQL